MREALGLDLVIIIPCSRSPHKPRCLLAPSRHRLRMVELAIGGTQGLEASDVEIRRGGVSYTVDTVRELRRRFGSRVEIWLLLGMDAYLDSPRWKDLGTLVRECHFGVACRPGYRSPARSGVAPSRTRFVGITAVDVSSTDVRRRLRAGKSIRYLVADPVRAYIGRHGLYNGRRRRGGQGACRHSRATGGA
jgi:nicotinate-nucleotide adenylyltransferase